MKEITRTITKKYDSLGRLVEHCEITVERDNVNGYTYQNPYYPSNAFPYSPHWNAATYSNGTNIKSSDLLSTTTAKL